MISLKIINGNFYQKKIIILIHHFNLIIIL